MAVCGISGIVGKCGLNVAPERIKKITDLIAHRGPDDAGVFFASGLALGHRRLAIIDLNRRGRQPMEFRGRYWITYNGEIYNYLEIRRELELLGVEFHTSTDTEVILAAYAQWGVDCLRRFNGMWAFAIYDSLERNIFIARDRFGIKPIYYIDTSREFAFGSELKQLIALQDRPVANQYSVIEWLLSGIDGHTDETYFAGIKALPQSHYMLYDVENHSFRVRRYYSLEVNTKYHGLTLEETTDAFRSILEDSIRLRLRSDVKVGTCLSGGLDSSAISAIASTKYSSSSGSRFTGIHAKSIAARTDESAFARRVADHANIDLRLVEPSTEDFVRSVDEVVYTQEEPFGSCSMFMGWHVFREAKQQGCRVMLNGQGGDEILLGYERYFAAVLKSLPAKRFFREAWKQAHNSRLGLIELLQYYAYFTNASIRIARLKARTRLRKKFSDAHDFSFVRRSAASFRTIEELQKFEITTLQLPHLLRYEDRSSMRHSVETRLPFLDYRLVETAVSLPVCYKIKDGWTKYVLRRAVADVLPRDIVWRKAKLGFEAPESIWLSAHQEAMKKEINQSRILEEITDRRTLIDRFASLPIREQWAYYNLAVWERVYGVEWC